MNSDLQGTAQRSFWRDLGPGNHGCHVYRDEAELLQTLSGFVGGALWSGEAAVVIATDAHLMGLESLLRQTGLDLAHFRGHSSYIPLSAELTLASFMDDGWPDGERFAQVMTPVVERARGGGRQVRAFGEMVALLWAKGHYAATVRLEHLWNKLIEKERVRLVCGYPKDDFLKAGVACVEAIYGAHSRVSRS